ncbi:GNAT family N-acetyltransferase [Pasteurella skyensis]|uniref:GNAT family N-acetyltransferase n=1 Tax=Phocoenobacter skyensis TaxID=97481 RepID=A0AAJ6N9Y7_9PAST|nr:GNAT family N-acetyltransferase [Pasteurella skyensis]MDP8162982.1 GNAT family N-acetyltransferase [Pasteurella skyensis]MDP8172866.1 GNAT family N-acetyltransferase [Pasteurella skyensis]MDP8176688.1 GNAT family N-acetyltransferase [Pasteurella skyensis]MDP8179366.1 GNAT family N-acetyltransferase [Pasteurella skyensis]MDP8183592.1 GNAT family N-acetyltransferase [Pasteurella skyensis]
MENYIFKSERLGFRNWSENDLEKLYEINSDVSVMEFFPSILSKNKTLEFIENMKKQFIKNKFCYFAVETLEKNEFIGFIGLNEQNYDSDFTPCIDIGWRLSKKYWNKGYATEGAKKCLEYAFEELGIKNIKSVCPKVNTKSENVMKKIGMKKIKEFNHPLLEQYKKIENCVLYEIEK